MTMASIEVIGFVLAGVLLASVYFRHVPITRPPIGVMNLTDTLVFMFGLVVTPYLYVFLAPTSVGVMLGIVVLSILYFTLEPILKHRLLVWSSCLIIVAADVGAALFMGTDDVAFLFINNATLLLAVIGVSNLWAQSGMRARDVTILAAALAVYDYVATWRLPVMTELFTELSGLPLAPLFGGGASSVNTSLYLGFGDVLMAALVPLVFRKAFGKQAGYIALIVGISTIAASVLLVSSGVVSVAIPVMIVLGPLDVVQYICWRSSRRSERTTFQYLLAESVKTR